MNPLNRLPRHAPEMLLRFAVAYAAQLIVAELLLLRERSNEQASALSHLLLEEPPPQHIEVEGLTKS